MNPEVPQPQPHKGNTRIFISLFVVTAVAMLSLGLIVPILPLYAKSMHATGLQLGMIFSGYALSRGIFSPVVGDISDRYGRKKLIVTGLTLFIPLSILFALANTPLLLTIIRIAQGVATVCISLVAQAYVGDLTPRGKEGKYMNLFFISFFLGQSLGPYFGGVLTDHFSIRTPFYVMAVLSAGALILILLFVPEAPIAARSVDEQASFFKRLKPALSDRPMIAIMEYMASRGFYRWGFNTFFPILAVKVASLNAASIGLVLSAYMVTGSVIQFPAGLAVDKYPEWKTPFILIGGTVSAIIMCIIASFQTLILFILLTTGMGIASAVARASAVAIRTERGRLHGMGAVTGAFTASLSLGQVLGPLVFGAVVDWLNIPDAFLIGGLVGLAGTFMATYFLKTHTEY